MISPFPTHPRPTTSPDSVSLYTNEEARRVDAAVSQSYGIPEILLMENAAIAALNLLKRKMPLTNRPVLILCGSGNNGGDGLALARQLVAARSLPFVFFYGSQEKLSHSATANLAILQKIGIPLIQNPSQALLQERLLEVDLVVDALLGVGLSRQIGPPLCAVISAINHSRAKILALDIPSGVNGDTGMTMGSSVQADWTISFGVPKVGTFLYPGFGLAGELFLTPISIPPQLSQTVKSNASLNLAPPLNPRDPMGHKGSYGAVLTVGGSTSYRGAPFFAAQAVLKTGTGLSHVVTPSSLLPSLACLSPELIFHSLPEQGPGSERGEALLGIARSLSKLKGVIIGPGLSLLKEIQETVRFVASSCPHTLLIDGDGLTAVAGHPEMIKKRTHPTILTPHLGEMAKLANVSAETIKGDPLGTLRRVCRTYGAFTLLKGPHTLIGSPDGQVRINLTGNSGMSTAGSGDVLAGTIMGLLGLTETPLAALCCGTAIHGMAGDLAGKQLGEDGMTAQDLLTYLPTAVKRYREDHSVLTASHFGQITLL